MSRLHDVLLSITADLSGGDLAEILNTPRRTADRWIAELRQGDSGNWNVATIESLARYELQKWGTTRIAEALMPVAIESGIYERADVRRLVTSLQIIIVSHQSNTALISEIVDSISDNQLSHDEVRRLLELTAQALETTAAKQQAIIRMQQQLTNYLKAGETQKR